MNEVVFAGLGLLAGAVLAWLYLRGRLEGRALASEARAAELQRQSAEREAELGRLRAELDSARQGRVAAETELKGSRQSLEEQKLLIETMKRELSDTFKALSSAALETSSEGFLRLAGEHLGRIVSETKGRLGEHQAAMDGLIKPLQETLKRYEEHLQGLEVKRRQDYTSLDEQIKILASTHRELQKETGNLVSALRKPHVRGRWGEVTLRNVVELAGMSSHCDFTEQVTVASDGGRLRPDMVVHLPGGHDIVVDSKVSMEALLDAAAAQSEEAKRDALKRHAQHLKEQVKRLSDKAYWSQFERAPELAVCFLGESALVAALEADPTIMEDSMSRKVLMATPTSLFALLTAVAYGWRQERLAQNAEQIATLGRELYDRVSVWARHMNDVGSALGKSVEAYNRAAGSMESRVLPSVRRFRELGATSSGEIPEIKQVEQNPRNLTFLE
ncbi:MAG: DNA recombination protein RmuC [Thermodesulfovibrionales bacterium]